jgi:predicted amidophosphoribosyltransferase
MLGEKDRRKNVKGVYRVVRPDRIKEKHIMIVDDVCTTGATIEEIAVVLLEKGAARVDAITVARAA